MKLKLLIALLIVQVGFAQQRKCGTAEYMERVMANPVLKQQYLEGQARFEAYMLQMNQEGRNTTLPISPNAAIRIPVAVHFPSAGSASAALKTCLRRLAQKQIDILNADYNATNADVSLWTAASVFYPGTSIGSMDVSFELATLNHPSGSGNVNGETAVTFGTNFLAGADSDPAFAGYCNLVVRVIGNQTLGYSPLGGYPVNGATVVIDSNAFGATLTGAPTSCTGYVPGYPYNLGRTLTHELGHFFNLRHTFEACDGANCANTGDRVCDTPEANDPEYNCLAAGSRASGCGGTQLTMNYMDYVQDRCMYMFTAGQATRMMAWYQFVASSFATNVLGSNEFVTRNFSIAPNPNNGTFAIQLKEQTDQFSVLIIDSLGRVVYDNEFNQTTDLVQTIHLNNALSGVYFVSIESNGETLTKKVIVE